MPFPIRPYQRFPVQCAMIDKTGPFFQVPLAYCLGFGLLITHLVLSCGTAYAEWLSVGGKVVEGLTDYTMYVELEPIGVWGSAH
jgi:hypothetical protein